MQKEHVQVEVLSRLRNVKGHIAGIERMVEEQQACANVMVQLSAVRSSIEKIGLYILENNAVECLGGANATPEDKGKIEQVVKQILTFVK